MCVCVFKHHFKQHVQTHHHQTPSPSWARVKPSSTKPDDCTFTYDQGVVLIHFHSKTCYVIMNQSHIFYLLLRQTTFPTNVITNLLKRSPAVWYWADGWLWFGRAVRCRRQRGAGSGSVTTTAAIWRLTACPTTSCSITSTSLTKHSTPT